MRMPSNLDPHLATIESWLATESQITALAIVRRLAARRICGPDGIFGRDSRLQPHRGKRGHEVAVKNHERHLSHEPGNPVMSRTLKATAVIIVMSLTIPTVATPQDNKTTFTLAAVFREEADKGNAYAQTGLGMLYFGGVQGVSQDYAEAAKWFRRAAAQGYPDAQNMLGNMYRAGRGVPQDYVSAHMWLNLAAAQSFRPEIAKRAAASRSFIAGQMTAAQIAEAQELARDWKPKLEQ
jgi:hypothetical protein